MGLSDDRQFRDMQEKLVAARQMIAEQQATIERVGQAPLLYAVVLATNEAITTLATRGEGQLAVMTPPNTKMEAGMGVLLSAETRAILGVLAAPAAGPIVTVTGISTTGLVEVAMGGAAVTVVGGIEPVTVNDRVVLDPTGQVIVHVLPPAPPRFVRAAATGISWDDIGGQAEAKREMIEAIEFPRRYPEIFRHYGKRPIKGVLLSGPPGCGKTLLGKAAATAIARLAGADGDGGDSSGFMYVKGPEILDPYVGVTERTIRELFDQARTHQAEHGVPAVIFIDEADAVLGKRGTRNAHMEKTIVPAFLTEMDGLDDSGALVILATNRPDTLDPAVVRDGRIDRRVRVSRPSAEDASAIFAIHLRGVPCTVERAVVAAAGVEALYHEDKTLYRLREKGGQQHTFTLGHLVSGSLIAGVVDQATSIAFHRDLAQTGERPSGVSPSDIEQAVARIFGTIHDTDHTDAVEDFTERRNIAPDTTTLERVAYAA